jgi:hypothetical protein
MASGAMARPFSSDNVGPIVLRDHGKKKTRGDRRVVDFAKCVNKS